MTELLVGVVVGGVVSLVSALAIESFRARREDSQRWDRDRLAAAVELVGAAQDLAGDQYRRGRAIQEFDDDTNPLRLAREEEGRQSLSHLWVTAAKAELLLPDAREQIQGVLSTARGIRDLADDGLESSAPTWKEARAQHHAAIEAFSAACRLPLRLVDRPERR